MTIEWTGYKSRPRRFPGWPGPTPTSDGIGRPLPVPSATSQTASSPRPLMLASRGSRAARHEGA